MLLSCHILESGYYSSASVYWQTLGDINEGNSERSSYIDWQSWPVQAAYGENTGHCYLWPTWPWSTAVQVVIDVVETTYIWIDNIICNSIVIVMSTDITKFTGNAALRFRAAWTKLELKKLYVEHVILPSKRDNNGIWPRQKIISFLSVSWLKAIQ